MLLFSAIVPPAQLAESLELRLGALRPQAPDARWTPPDRWHITLGFYGEAEETETRVDWLRKALAGQPAPVLRLEGAGTFSRVLYLGVYSESLIALATAAGAGAERPYLPHLAVARTTGDVPAELAQGLSRYVSEPWTAIEVVLMRSDPTPTGRRYSVVERFPLEVRPAGQASG
ncbi:RNA 2',3'-cyclic phosphodiesterase [Amycolatopsis acidicola]|uniref:RNA 2',3'-cyclic phosphodiesterase n=1 Tax=Amycolatopsis acidicola TaxID=2596893 RepID=A0A5N0UWN0_9PSEU|nr:RNA 2',3'-cyclic phosphodiesterase [Amycolatopsis acidicola]KAA9157598.1 RNA 2',3'-cyclic phosphodiesterase [Amycolatopsis acidicola]